MGATGWSFFRPYHEDMNAVLEALQRDVFESGDYERPSFDTDQLEEIEFFEAVPAEQWEMLKQYGLDALKSVVQQIGMDGLPPYLDHLRRKPSISRQDLDVMMCLSVSGTSSILDISGIADGSSHGALFPLSRSLLQRHFGTDQPTHEIVEMWRNRIIPPYEEPLHRRGEGIYFTVYKDGLPDEIYIEGCSGD